MKTNFFAVGLALVAGFAGAELRELVRAALAPPAMASPVPEYIREYALAQAQTPGAGGCAPGKNCSADTFTGRTLTLTGASGTVALQFVTGARADFGAGRYIYDDGSKIACNGAFSVGNNTLYTGVIQRNVDAQAIGVLGGATNSDGSITAVQIRRTNASSSHNASIAYFMNGTTVVGNIAATSGAIQILGGSLANRPACNSTAPGSANSTLHWIYVVTDDHKPYFCDGTNWNALY